VGVLVDALLGQRDAHLAQHLDGQLPGLPLALLLVEHDRFHDLVADGVDGVERGHRLLEDHGDLVPADRAVFLALGVEPGEVEGLGVAIVQNLPADDLARRRGDEPHDREGGL